MNFHVAGWPVAAALMLACAPALAAKATAISYVDTSHEPNVLGPGNTSCTISDTSRFECDRVIDAPLLASDPDGVRSEVTFYRDAYLPGGSGAAPDGILTGKARAYALPGSLHAGVEVEIGGRGYSPQGPGISAFGYVDVEDQIKVTSATLAKGTAITLSANLDINGQGRGSTSLTIRGSRPQIPGLTRVFGDSNNSNRDTNSLQDISGQFTAYVGETLYLEYALRASTGVTAAGWKPIDTLNGRAASSDYLNSAFLYFASDDPAVQWVADSGATYLAAAVPEPGSTAMMLLGLVALGAVARRSASRGCAVSG